MYTLLSSVRDKSPELEIPESTFYSQISGFNVYVKKKDRDGLLHHLMIYDYSDGFNNAQVIVADSGRLKVSTDKQFLVLYLFDGRMFKNLRDQGEATEGGAVPYQKESFKSREILIRFDSEFHRADESAMQDRYVGKNLRSLRASIDSMTVRIDSVKEANARDIYARSYRREFYPPTPPPSRPRHSPRLPPSTASWPPYHPNAASPTCRAPATPSKCSRPTTSFRPKSSPATKRRCAATTPRCTRSSPSPSPASSSSSLAPPRCHHPQGRPRHARRHLRLPLHLLLRH